MGSKIAKVFADVISYLRGNPLSAGVASQAGLVPVMAFMRRLSIFTGNDKL